MNILRLAKGNSKMIKKFSYILVGLCLIYTSVWAASEWAGSERGLELTRATDADIIAKTEILTAYGLNYWLYQMPLNVSVKNNTAIVFGKVQTPSQKYLAIEIAKSAQGIKNVDDQVQIDERVNKRLGQIKFIQKVRDLNVTNKIIEKIAKNNPFYGHINVVTYRGHVTLTGSVKEKKQKEQAERIASQTMGVESVTNQLEIK